MIITSSCGRMNISCKVLLFVVAIVVCPHLSQAVRYTVCDQNKLLSEVKDVKVSQCDSATETCPFIRGFNKSIELDFVPKQSIEQVKVKIAGKLKTLPVPFHINPDNACGNYGITCPLEAGKLYKFNLSLPILRTYPKIDVDVFLKLVDDKGDLISCIELPAKIQEPMKE